MVELDTGQKLHRMQDSQNSDGTVNLELIEWEEKDNKVYFDFLDPHGKEYNVSCTLPRSREEDVLFNRILDHTGWEFSTADQIEGEDIPAEPTNNGYDILPETPTLREKVRGFLKRDKSYNEPSALAKLGWALFHPLVFFFVGMDRANGWSNEYDNGWMDGIIAVWLYILLFILLILLL